MIILLQITMMIRKKTLIQPKDAEKEEDLLIDLSMKLHVMMNYRILYLLMIKKMERILYL